MLCKYIHLDYRRKDKRNHVDITIKIYLFIYFKKLEMRSKLQLHKYFLWRRITVKIFNGEKDSVCPDLLVARL